MSTQELQYLHGPLYQECIRRIDYMTKPGDRKRYFKVSPGKWLEQIQV